MHDIHCLADRISEMDSYARYLKRAREDLRDENDNVDASYPSSDHDDFVTSMKEASKAVNQARTFEIDLVRHINPLSTTVDKMFAFPLSPHCETTHEGMKMVFADMGQSFRMFNVDESGKARNLPNSKDRKVHLCVDALSSKMFRHLKMNLTKKLSELGSGPYVEPLLKALEGFTVQHDYLHEHRMQEDEPVDSQGLTWD